MPFNLFVIRRGGTEFKTLRSPYPDRAATVSSVRNIMVMYRDGEEFAEQVAAHPLGLTITHTVSGLGFRTEEV